MAHNGQRQFFERVRAKHPDKFVKVSAIDFGSLDINGSLRDLFTHSKYTGVDIRAGKNVDVVGMAHEYNGAPVDTVISGEMLEHDEHWMESLLNMYRLLKDGGLMALSMAGPTRPEHGTIRTDGPSWLYGTNPTYYRNITAEDLRAFMAKLPKPFGEYAIDYSLDKQDVYFYGIKSKPRILCSISTKNRYDNYLAMAIQSVATQTYKPDHLTIYDDNDNPKDLRSLNAYLGLFKLLDTRGIGWNIAFGKKQGQHHNHQAANKAGYDIVWRMDDDCIAESNVLEKLMAQMTAEVGAVGGSILMPNFSITGEGSSLITDIFTKPNKQWFSLTQTEEVDHLHCSFIYRAGIVDYELRLSNKAHREETMMSYALKLKGYKILITPCVTWHLKSATGGIRSDNNVDDYRHDEEIFRRWLEFNKTGKKLFVLNGGLGDNYMFLLAMDPLPHNSIVATCYPWLYEKLGIPTMSIADAQALVDIERYNIYGWCGNNHWQEHLIDAYKEMYKSL